MSGNRLIRRAGPAVTAAQAKALWARVPLQTSPGLPMGSDPQTGLPISGDPVTWARCGLLPRDRLALVGDTDVLVQRWVLGAAAMAVRPVVIDGSTGLRDSVAALGGQVIDVGRGADSLNVLDEPSHRLVVATSLVLAATQEMPTVHEQRLLAQATDTLTIEWSQSQAPVLWDLIAALQKLPGSQRLVGTLQSIVHHYGDVIARPTTTSVDVHAPALGVAIAGVNPKDRFLPGAVQVALWSAAAAYAQAADTITIIRPGDVLRAMPDMFDELLAMLSSSTAVVMQVASAQEAADTRCAVQVSGDAGDFEVSMPGRPPIHTHVTQTSTEADISAGLVSAPQPTLWLPEAAAEDTAPDADFAPDWLLTPGAGTAEPDLLTSVDEVQGGLLDSSDAGAGMQPVLSDAQPPTLDVATVDGDGCADRELPGVREEPWTQVTEADHGSGDANGVVSAHDTVSSDPESQPPAPEPLDDPTVAEACAEPTSVVAQDASAEVQTGVDDLLTATGSVGMTPEARSSTDLDARAAGSPPERGVLPDTPHREQQEPAGRPIAISPAQPDESSQMADAPEAASAPHETRRDRPQQPCGAVEGVGTDRTATESLPAAREPATAGGHEQMLPVVNVTSPQDESRVVAQVPPETTNPGAREDEEQPEPSGTVEQTRPGSAVEQPSPAPREPEIARAEDDVRVLPLGVTSDEVPVDDADDDLDPQPAEDTPSPPIPPETTGEQSPLVDQARDDEPTIALRPAYDPQSIQTTSERDDQRSPVPAAERRNPARRSGVVLGAAAAVVLVAAAVWAQAGGGAPEQTAISTSSGGHVAAAAVAPALPGGILALGADPPTGSGAVLAARRAAPATSPGGGLVVAGRVPPPSPGAVLVAAATVARPLPDFGVTRVSWARAASWSKARQAVVTPVPVSIPGTTVIVPQPVQPANPQVAPPQSGQGDSTGAGPANDGNGGGAQPAPGAPPPNQPFNPQNPDSP